MKQLFLLLALMSSSCTKEDDFISTDPINYNPPVINDKLWLWSFYCPDLDINITDATHYRSAFLYTNNRQSGKMVWYDADSVQFIVTHDYRDGITSITGTIENHSFIVLDNKMNVCGGYQGLSVTYSLNPVP